MGSDKLCIVIYWSLEHRDLFICPHLRHEGIRAGDSLRVSEAVEDVRKYSELAKWKWQASWDGNLISFVYWFPVTVHCLLFGFLECSGIFWLLIRNPSLSNSHKDSGTHSQKWKFQRCSMDWKQVLCVHSIQQAWPESLKSSLISHLGTSASGSLSVLPFLPTPTFINLSLGSRAPKESCLNADLGSLGIPGGGAAAPMRTTLWGPLWASVRMGSLGEAASLSADLDKYLVLRAKGAVSQLLLAQGDP